MHAALLRTAIERSWTSTTTYCPEDWSAHDPAWGQCAVTSVLVNETYGGELVLGEAETPDGDRTRHYWNCIDGVLVDLTWRQFPVGTTLGGIEAADRATLIANPWMEARYAELQANVARELEHLTSLEG